MYDITNGWSFDGIDRWIREIDEVLPAFYEGNVQILMQRLVDIFDYVNIKFSDVKIDVSMCRVVMVTC